MRVLALDTSSPAVTAGLVAVEDGATTVLDEVVRVDGKRHGELLALGVRELLQAGRPDAIVVGTGPGPFTGLRVGLMTGMALADAWGLPAYGVCSLDAVATGGACVVVTDARRREVYWARYDGGARVEGPTVEDPRALGERLRATAPGTLLAGAAVPLFPDAFSGLAAAPAQFPAVEALAARAAERILGHQPGEALTPLYLRRPDATPPGAVKAVTSPARPDASPPVAVDPVTSPAPPDPSPPVAVDPVTGPVSPAPPEPSPLVAIDPVTGPVSPAPPEPSPPVAVNPVTGPAKTR